MFGLRLPELLILAAILVGIVVVWAALRKKKAGMTHDATKTVNGDVDAIVTRPPYIIPIERRLGANGVIWPAQSSQALYAILVGKNDWITEHPGVVDRLLSALARAEDYLVKHPNEARAIVQKRLNYDDATIASIWPDNQFSLTLDQSLVLALEDEARWMMSNNLTAEKSVPNFLDYMYEDALKAIMPKAVSIIR